MEKSWPVWRLPCKVKTEEGEWINKFGRSKKGFINRVATTEI